MYQAKAQFRAQYIGQMVLSHDKIDKPWILTSDCIYSAVSDNEICLSLRGINQLTDEELIMIANHIGLARAIINRYENRISITDDSYNLYLFFDCIFQTLKNGKPYIDTDLLRVYQICLGIGILLPFTYLEDGKPITLQPEEIIKLRWVKLKTD